MNATFTKLTQTVQLDMIDKCFRPWRKWPIFHTWLTMVRKIRQSYIQYLGMLLSAKLNYTICTSWHDLLIAFEGLCPWPTFTFQWLRHKMAIAGPLWLIPSKSPVSKEKGVDATSVEKRQKFPLYISHCNLGEKLLFTRTQSTRTWTLGLWH